MIILPAIDIKDRTCVRLFKGEFSTVEKVADDYLETAMKFEKSGATWIHMVDLDGALLGKTVNMDIFVDVAKNTSLKVEVGGGIRDLATIEKYLDNGISRVILGSVALSDPKFVKESVEKFGEKIAVGIDAKNGYAASNGWIDESQIHYIELAKRMQALGVEYIIYTDISKDGTLTGPNLSHLKELSKEVFCNIIASGGIHNIIDIENLIELGMYGTICGKSIYTGDLKLEEAIRGYACKTDDTMSGCKKW